VRLKPGVAAMHFNLAVALLKVPGRAGEAVTQLQAALRIEPGNVRARQILSSIR